MDNEIEKLINCFIHILDKTKDIRNQGQIIAITNEYVFVQLFSFADERPTEIRPFPIWILNNSDESTIYPNVDEMKIAYNAHDIYKKYNRKQK